MHINRHSHSGQRFQLALTGMPHRGQDSGPRGVSQAGQTFQFALIGSPQDGQRFLSAGLFMD
jgi:hypothetical protein